MNSEQYIKKLPVLLKELNRQPLINRSELAGVPKSGIYVFYENDKPLYVGRSNRIKERIQEHGRPSSDHYSATFAILLTKEKRNIKGKVARDILSKDPEYLRAKSRVANMKVKIIDIEDQILQALFEIFVHLELNTKYNDFRTH